jgi:hypothetical protein
MLFVEMALTYLRSVIELQYGLVPQPVYPESTHSSLSKPLNKLLRTKLREHALVLRDLSLTLRSSGQLSGDDITSSLRSKKEELLLGEVYRVMSATLGVPPEPNDKFVWDYYDKDGKAGQWEGTAKEFYTVRPTCSRLWVRKPLWLIYLGVLKQGLSSLRHILFDQRPPQLLLEAVYSRQIW